MPQKKIELPKAFAELTQPSRYKAFYGGRGSAKSHSFATALLLRGMLKPVRVLCCREVQLSIKDSVKQLLDDKIAALDFGYFYESVQSEIRGANGTAFIFAGLGKMTTDQIKSYEGVDIVWVEEAQTISAHSLEILIPTIRKPESELWFSWNPRHATDPVDKRFRGDNPPPKSIIRKVNFDANPFYPDELNAEREYDEENNVGRYAHIWLGSYEPQAVGAIWDRSTLNQHRVHELPQMQRILVAIDPAISAEDNSNETGIVVAGIGADDRGYILDDRSLVGDPHEWASAAVNAFDEYEADGIVCEINQGGAMVAATLQSVRPDLPVIEVRATRGKHVRAEPIAALYKTGRISHCGTFLKLEDQMCLMTASGFDGEGSPDRVDAMVWAFTELFPALTRKKVVRREKAYPELTIV